MQRGSESCIYGFGIKQNQRELRRYEHEHFHNENRNRGNRGLEIRTGYGTQFYAVASVPAARVTHVQAGMARAVQAEETRGIGQRCIIERPGEVEVQLDLTVWDILRVRSLNRELRGKTFKKAFKIGSIWKFYTGMVVEIWFNVRSDIRIPSQS